MSMKTPFLLYWLCPFWLNAQRPALAATVRNNQLLELMAAELTPKNLQSVYKNEFYVEKSTKNVYEPTTRDILLVVNTSADKLKVFKNKYNTLLLSATLTSPRLAFGHSIRIGATKAAFCKAFGLSPKYSSYQIIENPEGGYEMDFYFKEGVLTKVIYQTNYVD